MRKASELCGCQKQIKMLAAVNCECQVQGQWDQPAGKLELRGAGMVHPSPCSDCGMDQRAAHLEILQQSTKKNAVCGLLL